MTSLSKNRLEYFISLLKYYNNRAELVSAKVTMLLANEINKFNDKHEYNFYTHENAQAVAHAENKCVQNNCHIKNMIKNAKSKSIKIRTYKHKREQLQRIITRLKYRINNG